MARHKVKRPSPPATPISLRAQLDAALAEAGRWRSFAEATQAVCLQQRREIEELKARPLIGCDQCQYTGRYDWIDPETGEVVRVLCGCCRDVVEAAVDLYLRVTLVAGIL